MTHIPLIRCGVIDASACPEAKNAAENKPLPPTVISLIDSSVDIQGVSHAYGGTGGTTFWPNHQVSGLAFASTSPCVKVSFIDWQKCRKFSVGNRWQSRQRQICPVGAFDRHPDGPSRR